MEPTQNLLSGDLKIEPTTQLHLRETAMWGKFLGIVGIVISILVAIIGLFAGAIFSGLKRYGGADMAAGASVITVLYLIFSVIIFFLSLYLLKFASQMKLALLTNDQANLDSSFHHLKLVFRIQGIITIIYLGLIAIGLLAGIAGSAFMR